MVLRNTGGKVLDTDSWGQIQSKRTKSLTPKEVSDDELASVPLDRILQPLTTVS